MRTGETPYPSLNFQISDNTKLHVYRGAAMGGLDDIRIVLGPDATVMDVLRAWYEAMRTARYLKQGTEEKMYEETWAETAADEYEKLWLRMEVAGWNLKTQSLETGAPLRVELVPVTKKKQ